MNLMTVDFAFLFAFLFGIACAIVGLVVGLRHQRSNQTTVTLVHNNLISRVTGWIREERDRIATEIVSRNGSAQTAVDMIAAEIEKAFIRKGVK